MNMNESNAVNPIDKLVNLTIDENNNVVSVPDRTVYGLYDTENTQWIFYNPTMGSKTTYRNDNVTSIQLAEGKATIYLKGKRPNSCPQFLPRDGSLTEPKEKDPEIVEETPDTSLDKYSLKLEEIDSKLIGMRMGCGGFGPTPIYDDEEENIYGYFTETFDKITFSDGVVYNALQCPFEDIETVEKEETESIKVTFKDGKIRHFKKYIETEKGISPKPDFDSSFIGLEEIIRYIFGSELLNEYLYTSEINHKIYFDWKLIGMESVGLTEYQAAGELTKICQIIEDKYQYIEQGRLKHPKISRENVGHILTMIAQNNKVNPFLNEIRKVQPDERYKIEHFLRDVGLNSRLTDYDKDNEYIEKVSCALFLAVIERQFVNDEERSIRFVPVLIGGQRPGKSLICKKLGLTKYYKESKESIDDEKKYIEGLDGGCIIAEMAEGTQFTKNKEKAYKEWFDKNSTSFRMSYARQPTTFQKRFIEIITTNDHQILTDITGNSRYYPIFLDPDKAAIPIQEHDTDMMKKYYADALKRYENGERWYNYVDNDEFQSLADVVRTSVTRDIDGLPELIDYARNMCPEIGSRVLNEELKAYLTDVLYCDTKQRDKLLTLWGKVAGNYGFVKIPEGQKVKDGLRWVSIRGYERFR